MNTQIFSFFYNFAHQSVFFDKLVIFFAVTFPYIVILLAVIFLLFHHHVLPSQNPLKEFAKKWQEIFFIFITGIGAWTLASILKILVHIERPFIALQNVHNLFPETGHAFPSGHATFFMALGFAIFFLHKKAGYFFIFFAFLIGIARIVGGVHFPIDILGGYILGFAIAFFLKNV